MRVQNVIRKSLTEIESNTIYHGCTFYIDHPVPILHNSQFYHCSFRGEKLVVDEIYNCTFIHCNMNELKIKASKRVSFDEGYINEITVEVDSAAFVKMYFNYQGNYILLEPHGFLGKETNVFSQALNLIPRESTQVMCNMEHLQYLAVRCFYRLQSFMESIREENGDIRFYKAQSFMMNLFAVADFSEKLYGSFEEAMCAPRYRKAQDFSSIQPTQGWSSDRMNNLRRFTYTSRSYCFRATTSPLQK
ncbi:hypothetical protein [Candidatus Uabimicrobium amorphum]|uniref:Uncharacterized protein n=1 Tax=Uabimicrobium amorphum TaxID=2596890 RepID=A0A5S9F4N9_UABAM|nr:hypothetical protein [Candidatus Uabimicrobium amorphum]BBM85986.1 hypothetical protein UABAM_04372 [Candidatus Uabimicrobium amorphum]